MVYEGQENDIIYNYVVLKVEEGGKVKILAEAKAKLVVEETFQDLVNFSF
jgi:hypothetical protein